MRSGYFFALFLKNISIIITNVLTIYHKCDNI
nr:MAG TPA: hypothetical protein [Caudoviricetes sp.]